MQTGAGRTAVVAALGFAAACGDSVPSPRHPTATFASISEHLHGPVTNGGLVFPDASCAAQFSAPSTIAQPDLDAFAHCLATLELGPDPRSNPMADALELVDPRGLEIVARFDAGALTWIGSSSRRIDPHAPVMISSHALEQLRAAGDRDGPLATSIATHEPELAWLRVCLDPKGAIVDTTAIEATSFHAARSAMAATSTWTFRPFAPSGTAMPACAMVRLGSRNQPLREIRPSVATTRDPLRLSILAPGLHRKRGQLDVAPTLAISARMDRDNLRTLRGEVAVCFDNAGRVTSTYALSSSGFPQLDANVLREVTSFEYEPYLDDGRPVAACTSVPFTIRHENTALCRSTGRRGCDD